MNTFLRNTIAPVLCLTLLGGCTFLHDDKTVAKVGTHKLYKSQVVKFIPPGLPKRDSAALARQYINAWASELIMTDMANTQLSKKERDVTKELEDYKYSLLKYRYEQHYIQDRLDTVVSDEQVKAHYKSHPELYLLNIPIVKAVYVRVSADCPLKNDIMDLMKSEDAEDAGTLKALAEEVAGKYYNYSEKWIDAITLARNFGIDYASMLASRKDSFIEIEDQDSRVHIAYLSEFIPAGKVPPLEYCEDKIREVIVSQRKYALSSTLEQELLDDAMKKGNFVIYETNEE